MDSATKTLSEHFMSSSRIGSKAARACSRAHGGQRTRRNRLIAKDGDEDDDLDVEKLAQKKKPQRQHGQYRAGSERVAMSAVG